MRWWTDRLLPRVIDWSLSAAEFDRFRARVCRGLSGEVLELGFGSGLNLRHYPAEVTTVLAVEPSDVAWRLAESRRAAAPAPVRRAGLDGQRLELDDATLDHVLSTMTMCTIPDLTSALGELRRVLRPGGTLHFLEHGRAPERRIQRWQRRLDPWQQRLFGGCHLTRPIDELVRSAGFTISDLDTFYLPGPSVARPFDFVYLGRATSTLN